MDKGLKKCSTSADVELVRKATNPLQKAKKELDNLEIKEKQKKQKKDKKKSGKMEIKKLRNSFKELTGIMKELQEIFQSKANLPMISFGKKEEAPKKKVHCCMNKRKLRVFSYYTKRKGRTVGTPFSNIGRFTDNRRWVLHYKFRRPY